jgi:hypothetical protein
MIRLNVLHKQNCYTRYVYLLLEVLLSVYIFGLSGINKTYPFHICALIWTHLSKVAEMYPLLSLKMTL